MILEEIEKYIDYRKEVLDCYVPIDFFRSEKEKCFKFFIKDQILLKDNKNLFFDVNIEGEKFIFIYEFLDWDSTFFNMPILKLNYILFKPLDYEKLLKAILVFKEKVIKNHYIFSEIPSEDIYVIQALNESIFRLIETRLTYYLNLHTFQNERFNVREALTSDINNLKRVSSEMVNPFDRFHADNFFNKEIADKFLGVFAEESVKGFADYVMVPGGKDVSPDSFLTAKYNKNWWKETNIKVSKMVLSAVSSKTNRGWYIKLISEMAFHLKEIGADYAIMHPASTNKAVIHSYEKLGCKLGKTTHILSYKKR